MAATGKRPFRTTESFKFEKASRDAVAPFLKSRGISVLAEQRPGNSQIISATMPNGSSVRMRVRLCWRRDGRKARENKYSAFQLQSKNAGGDWDAALKHVADRDISKEITHTLAIQGDGRTFVYAVMIPTREIPAIWRRQREVSARLIREGGMGRLRKNHAENGSSPTIWLQDTRTPKANAVAELLWDWPGVIDLNKLAGGEAMGADDTFDDCTGQDTSLLGSDAPGRATTQRSYVKRDPRVRKVVLQRAHGKCERDGCGTGRDYPGFLDVHHILGAAKSDRVSNCVALCPNCHREAHFSPERDEINRRLLAFAEALR